MKNFEFGCPVMIQGETYRITNNVKAVTRATSNLTELIKDLKDPDEVDAKTRMAFMAAIDTMIGQGSFKKIFGDGEINVLDVGQLLKFLRDEWSEYSRSVFKIDAN